MDYEPKLFLSVPEAARELHTKPEALREWAVGLGFPIRRLPGRRHGIVMIDELKEWYLQNACGYKEARR